MKYLNIEKITKEQQTELEKLQEDLLNFVRYLKTIESNHLLLTFDAKLRTVDLRIQIIFLKDEDLYIHTLMINDDVEEMKFKNLDKLFKEINSLKK